MAKGYAGRLFLASMSLFVCSLCNIIWKKIFLMSTLIEKVGTVGDGNFQINSISDWLEIITSGSHASTIHRLTLEMIIPLDIICAVIGLIYSIARFTKHDFGKLNIIPVILGVIICITGAASFVLLAVSGKAVIMSLILLFITFAVIPGLFLAFSVKYYKEK